MSTPSTPSKPRTIDPEILKLREAHKANVAKLQFERKSAETLKRIVEKELPKLTEVDRLSLLTEVKQP